MLKSHIEQRGNVVFPDFRGEKHYMIPFNGHLPSELKRWQKTVDMMLDGLEIPDQAYLMIDEAFVRKGQYHRRPGLHIDGYWDPGLGAHRGGHTGSPSHRSAPRHRGGSHCTWSESKFEKPEALILASNIGAAQGFVGEFENVIGEGGDCGKVDITNLERVEMLANTCYAGNVTSLHESLPVPMACYRQLVRLNVPGLGLKAA